MNNPFLQPFPTQYQLIPFDRLRAEHFVPALETRVAESRAALEKLADSQQSPSFEVIEGLDALAHPVDLVAGTFFNLLAAKRTEEMEAIAEKMSHILNDFQKDIFLNHDIFQKIQTVYQNRDELSLNKEQQELLNKTYRNFVRNGALLSLEQKQQLRKLDQQLQVLSLQFAQNALKSRKEFQLVITEEKDLAGLPSNLIQQAREYAKQLGQPGNWAFTLDMPSYIPFMRFAENRQLRQQMLEAAHSVAYKHPEYDNREITKKILLLRYQRAQLLGYSNHAEYVLEERMAKSSQTVYQFLDELYQAAYPKAQQELREIEQLQHQLIGSKDVQKWDYSFLLERLKHQKFQFDESKIRPYFSLENVKQGLFQLIHKLYNLSFHKLKEVPVYDPQVEVYKVVEESTQKLMGILYLDLFPRESKRSGAWMAPYRNQYREEQQDVRPHVSIVCNFTPPVEGKPALLSFREVRTLFHEFGHALHCLLSRCHYASLSGVHVSWDFVELPSKIMENWLKEQEFLNLFACHYQSGEPIPSELLEALNQVQTFHEGYPVLNQVGLSYLDMDLHHYQPSEIEEIQKLEQKSLQKTSLLPLVAGSRSCSFNHIFSGGYSAGYYSYQWSEVLDADAFELFQDQGIFNPQVAKSFEENILSKGASEDPSQLYRKFRGKDPSIDAFLKRSGLKAG